VGQSINKWRGVWAGVQHERNQSIAVFHHLHYHPAWFVTLLVLVLVLLLLLILLYTSTEIQSDCRQTWLSPSVSSRRRSV
jgi:hypothetical protein